MKSKFNEMNQRINLFYSLRTVTESRKCQENFVIYILMEMFNVCVDKKWKSIGCQLPTTDAKVIGH